MTIVKKPERIFDDPPMDGEIGILKIFSWKSIEVSVVLVLVVAAIAVWTNISDMTLVKGVVYKREENGNNPGAEHSGQFILILPS
jgi:hypothetical protein